MHTHSNREQSQGTEKTGQQTDRPMFVSRQTGRRRQKTDNRLTDSRFSGILSLGNQLIDLRSRV